MYPIITRRRFLLTGACATAAGLVPPLINVPSGAQVSDHRGVVVGEGMAAEAGARILSAGGNAIDAVVAAAFVAGVASPHNCGPGGYGGHMVIALSENRRVAAIDFNTVAPQQMRSDLFVDSAGNVKQDEHNFGWLSAGVPGTLAGLQLASQQFGRLPLRDLLAPAIKLARSGFVINTGMASALRASARQLKNDAASARLFFRNGELLQQGDRFQNPDLAQMLATFAERNSADSFYRGDIAQQIAREFQKHGGLVTAQDMADYRALNVETLHINVNGAEIHTAPLTSGGLTVLESLMFLRELDWARMPAGPEKTHARLEALRIAWSDRLELFGDPLHSKVPVDRLISADYAKERAQEIRSAVRDRRSLPLRAAERDQNGTIHLSSVDSDGNMAALTLTHGGSFGARVTVDGLGLVLGHGMSRFEPRPGHPNSPGPGKRPLHNMCPTIVTREGHAVAALGGAGGRKIPNAVLDVLIQNVVLKQTMEHSLAAPRLHCEGTRNVVLEKSWPAAESDYLREIGYNTQMGASAKISLVSGTPDSREFYFGSR